MECSEHGGARAELALPAEVWYEVAKCLDPKSLAQLSLVSRFFGIGVCRQPIIWRHLFQRELASRRSGGHHPLHADGALYHHVAMKSRGGRSVGGPGSLRYWQSALRCLVVPSVGRVSHAFVRWPLGDGHYVGKALLVELLSEAAFHQLAQCTTVENLFGLDQLVADKPVDDESTKFAEGEMKRKRDQMAPSPARRGTKLRAVATDDDPQRERRKEASNQLTPQTARLPPLRAPPYTLLVARDLSCAQVVKRNYMSKEWAEDANQSLWDPYSYVMQDRRERRRRLGVAIPQRDIKDIEELRHIFIPSVHKDDQLIRCIGTGNETEAIKMLAKGADPDSICGSGTYTSLSALSVAVRLKQTRLIEALILKGAALHNRGKGIPPLCKAAEVGDVDAIRAICRAFATLTAEAESSDASDDDRQRWLRALRTLNRSDVLNGVYSVEELVDTPEQFCGFTPLMLAAREGHLNAVRVLVEEMGAGLEHVSDDGKWTALLIAAWRERNDVVDYLLSAGANRFWTNSLGRNLDAITAVLKQQAALARERRMQAAASQSSNGRAPVPRGEALKEAWQDCRHCGGVGAVLMRSRLLFGNCQACGKLSQRSL